METSLHGRRYHGVRFADAAEMDAFVRALHRYLRSPRGDPYLRTGSVEAWADAPRCAVYLSDEALAAAEGVFAPVPVTSVLTSLPDGCALVLREAELNDPVIARSPSRASAPD